jgi:hypothetical protein
MIIRQQRLCLEKMFFWHRSIEADVKFEDVRLLIVSRMSQKGLSIREFDDIKIFASHAFDNIYNNINILSRESIRYVSSFHFQFQLLFLLYCKNVLLNRECEFTQMRFKDVRFRISNLMAQKRNSLSIRELEAVMSFTSQTLGDISSRFIAEWIFWILMLIIIIIIIT